MVPTSKPRVKEMVEVRDSMKWNEVYKVTDLDPRERCPQLPAPDVHIVLITSACHSKKLCLSPVPTKHPKVSVKADVFYLLLQVHPYRRKNLSSRCVTELSGVSVSLPRRIAFWQMNKSSPTSFQTTRGGTR